MKILIAGGGIGGLTLALMLHERGIDAHIFEQSREIRELGVGINTLPHAIAELERLGLLPALDAVAVRTRRLIYKTGRGQDIVAQPRGIWAGLDSPQFSIHRGRLQKVIHDAVLDRLGPDAISSDRRLVSFEQSAEKVTAHFESRDGSRFEETGDVLIGADGIHSVVRGNFYPDQGAPQWNGVLMWRGAVWWPRFLDGASMIVAGGMRHKLVLYPITHDPDRPHEALTNWVVCSRLGDGSAPIPTREDWSRKAPAEEALRMAEGHLSVPELDITDLIRATGEIFVYPMCDRDALPRWSHGRVTLLGDAAHPMYPVGSNGASQAILDARDLADRLAQGGDVVQALEAYDAKRRPATAAIVAANRSGGPEGVIDFVENRAPDRFADIHDIATPEELRAIVGDYETLAGFAAPKTGG
ncbi:flavin-dependent oxidoreductase [Paracoccus onubensis]|uniref:Flavin-dependent oxidoreductase n=1 Tax=Paracoccus onubensis TaxID=1675788 RepID=A0A418T8A7_9RHOB|nr:flavin-dependent oxidoreductase [Paracoccus onubensis]RJE89407.1 flavin-dependent oxidoreductase [Paracoccus onubensis]